MIVCDCVNTEKSICANWGKVERLKRLKVANEKQYMIPYATQLVDYHVTQLTVEHSSNITVTIHLIVWLNGLFITLAPPPTQNQIPLTQFDIISLGADAV